MGLIQLRDVLKTYHAGVQQVDAVRGVNLQIKAGEFAALAGPSGSGKTTLLNLIGGLDQASAGQVIVDGCNLAQCSPTELADFRLQRIGFIFQSFNLIPVLTARENAEFVLMLRKVPVEKRHDRIDFLFRELGISGLEQRRPMELSGGQQQRVAVARAMAAEPAVVLADEPTANLDSDTATDLLFLMQRLNREQGTTFLFSSHDPKVIGLADRVVNLKDGRIVE
ncbi:MAG: ABC transporter ATP-binding protein [Desulfuromonadales bacterium]|jgi:putative ABC transport system ATP-binding protein|nr:ABC transporter ATP-binding protein [Desulfuromonadales bacterium]